MKRIKLLLLAVVSVCMLSSCTIDSLSYSYDAYPYRVHYAPTIRTYAYDVRPDYVRYRRYYRYSRNYHHHH